MPKHSGLGKGLDALIPSGFQTGTAPAVESTPAIAGLLTVPIDQIVPNPRQPRSHFDQTALAELAASIREYGVIQPLIVSRTGEGTSYTLVAGERRLQASQLAGLTSVPVIVRQTTDQQRLELALIENIQRADLNPLEEASAYRQLFEEFRLSHEEIGARVGKSRVAITNTLRLLNLPAVVQKALLDSLISEGHARALLGLSNPLAVESALRTVLLQKMSVRQTEELVNKLKGEKPSTPTREDRPPEEKSLEEFIRANLSQKISVKIGREPGNGSVTLYYGSEEEFQDLMIRLTGQKYTP